MAPAASVSPEPQIRLFVPSESREPLPKRIASRAVAWAGLLLAGYWVAAFTATHVPFNEGAGSFLNIPHADKAVHMTLYTGLSLLLSVWFGVRRRVGRALVVAAVVACVLAGYAALDEISQAPVGRDPDLRDWFADMAGINFGICGFFALRSWVRRSSGDLGGTGRSRDLASSVARHGSVLGATSADGPA